MICTCPVCNKRFEVLWPHLWAYKIGAQPVCTWKCIRTNEKKKEGVNEVSGKTKVPVEAKKKAIQAAIDGKDPYEELSPYTGNPKAMWTYIKMMVKQKDPELYAKLPDLRDRKKQKQEEPKQEEPEQTLGDVMVDIRETADKFFGECQKMGLLKEEKPEKPEKQMEKRITGLMVEIGDFHYYPKTGYVDWTPVGHTDTVSLIVEEWRQVIEDLPAVLRELGVEP